MDYGEGKPQGRLPAAGPLLTEWTVGKQELDVETQYERF